MTTKSTIQIQRFPKGKIELIEEQLDEYFQNLTGKKYRYVLQLVYDREIIKSVASEDLTLITQNYYELTDNFNNLLDASIIEIVDNLSN